MITLLRKIRRTLLAQNRFSKYLVYAIGEIILVVIGILIALEINNGNELNKQRVKEVHYLKNLQSDLHLNIAHINSYIKRRETAINSAKTIIAHYEGKPITNLETFNVHTVNIYTWRKFTQINNTFQELMNSGNLALISNDSIKGIYLNMEALYNKLKYEEAHFRFDAEELLYKTQYDLMDMNPIVQNYMYQASKGAMGERRELSKKEFGDMLKSTKMKNGFVMAVYEFTVMNQMFTEMKGMCEQLIQLIDKEVKND